MNLMKLQGWVAKFLAGFLPLTRLASIVWSFAWVDRSVTWFPIYWTNFAIFIGVLECLHKAENFFHITPNWRSIHSNLANYTRRINDVQSSHGVSVFEEERSILCRNCFLEIGNHWDV